MESSKLASRKSKSHTKTGEFDSTITACDTTTQIDSQHSGTPRKHGVPSGIPSLCEDALARNLHLMQRFHPLGDKWREAASEKGDNSDFSFAHEHRHCLPPFEGHAMMYPTRLLDTDKTAQDLQTSVESDGFMGRDATDQVSRKRHFEEVDCNSDGDMSDSHMTHGSRSRVPEHVRLRINSRERQRMHDLNSALDSLRQVMPYTSGSSVKKLSKMSTLLLARNYIVTLTRSLDELRRLVQELMLLQPARLDKATAAAYDVIPAATTPRHLVATSPSSMKPAAQTPLPSADICSFSLSMTSNSPVATIVPASAVAQPAVPATPLSTTAAHAHSLSSPTGAPAPGLPLIADPALYASWVASSASLLRGAHVVPHSAMFHPAYITHGAPASLATTHPHIRHSCPDISGGCLCVRGCAGAEMRPRGHEEQHR